MAKRLIRKGRGITETASYQYDGDDLMEGVAAVFLDWTALREKWGHDYGAETDCMYRTCSAENLAGEHEPDSDADFARRILNVHSIALNAIERGDADMAARMAWGAGVLWAQWQIKRAHEKNALNGKKQVKSAISAGRMRSIPDDKICKAYEEAARKYSKLKPGGKLDDAAAELLGCASKSVARWRKRNGLVAPQKPRKRQK